MNIGSAVRRSMVLVVAPFFAAALWASEARPNPAEFMRKVIENEVNAGVADHTSWHYLEQRDDGKKNEVRDVVETPNGVVYRVRAVNGDVPSSEAECRRVTKLLSDPAELQHNWQSQQNDLEKLRALMRLMPEAFLYHYDEAQSEPGRVRMSFTQNPDFHPTTETAEIFRHLEGYVVVDTQAMRLAEINARMVSSAKFGGGLLGHLDSGGTFTIRQEDVGNGHWEATFVDVNMHGRLLFVSFGLHQRINHSEYEQLPDNIAPKQIIALMVNDSNAENAALR